MQQATLQNFWAEEKADTHQLKTSYYVDQSLAVLLAEDDAGDRELAMHELDQVPAVDDVFCVKDGTELMRYLTAKGSFQRDVISLRPTVVLLDLNMPKMDGKEALYFIKSDPFLIHVPVVVLSGRSSPEAAIEAYNYGADAFMTKPLDHHQLETIIHEMVY